MRSRTIPPLTIGLASLFLTACAPRLVVIETCPTIPAALTEPCRPPAREIATNGDLARAYLDAAECVDEAALKMTAIRALADCRVDTPARAGRPEARESRRSSTGASSAR